MNRTKQAVTNREIADLEIKLDALMSIQSTILDEMWETRKKLAVLEDTLEDDRWLGRDWTNGSK